MQAGDDPTPSEPAARSSEARSGRWGGWRSGGAATLVGVVSVVLVVFALTSRDAAVEPPLPADRGATSPPQDRRPVYLALGDSLSRGVQPDGAKTLRNGYPRQLEALLSEDLRPAPRLVEAGCGGATTTSMIEGGKPCEPDASIPYENDDPATSQLTWARDQLAARRDLPTLVTLTIGGNDLTPCADRDAAKVRRCLTRTLPGLEANWRRIAATLSDAAGPRTVLAVLTTYDPILGYVRIAGGRDAEAAGTFHRSVVREVNPAIRGTFSKAGWVVGDLAYAMHEQGSVKRGDDRAVAAVCALSWACSRADIHLNDEGYAVAADVLRAAVIDRLERAAKPTPAPAG